MNSYVYWQIFVVIDIVVCSHPVVNGRAAKSNQFPFAVVFAILNEQPGPTEKTFKVFCGGTIVETNLNISWAISAAHCFLNSNIINRTIYASSGGGNIKEAKWEKVEKIIISKMNAYTLENDIAMIRLTSPSHRQQKQAFIARSRQIPIITDSPVDSRECLIYGYGSKNGHINIFPNRIHYARANLLSYQKCESIVGRVIAPNEASTQICALGRDNADACSGDSGSGLICQQKNGHFELIGITSFGMGCGDGSVGIYESVAHHAKWIDSVISSEKCSKN